MKHSNRVREPYWLFKLKYNIYYKIVHWVDSLHDYIETVDFGNPHNWDKLDKEIENAKKR